MYKKKCKWCGNLIEVKKQNYFALHVANCNENPNKKLRIEKSSKLFKGKEKVKRIVIKQNCPKCNKEFEVRVTESIYRRNKYKKFCSIKCANSKKWGTEHRKKLSETCKKSEKVKKANISNILKLKEYNKKHKIKRKGSTKKINDFICQYCGEVGQDNRYNKNRKYHKECWLKISGGIKKGSSRGKCGWYNDYWCDSSYELAYVIYCLDHNLSIERNKEYFYYYWKDKKKKYYPDFRVNGKLTEIKNYRSELTNVKLNAVDEDIDIYYKDTIKPILKYVINKYGNDFIKMYEK